MASWRIKLIVSYDGTDFYGWQKQKPQYITVQGALELALQKVFQTPISIFGSGRTDAGVHARNQVAHFDAPHDPARYNMCKALNSFLPRAIVVKQAFYAPPDFHSLHSALKKTYRYRIITTEFPCPLRKRYATWYRHPVSLGHLNEYAKKLCGTHDFKSFQNAGTDVGTTVREVLEASWSANEIDEIDFSITATGFLKQMVRNIVGTSLYLASQQADPTTIEAILKACDRRKALKAAPPQGLSLETVYYPMELDNQCRPL